MQHMAAFGREYGWKWLHERLRKIHRYYLKNNCIRWQDYRISPNYLTVMADLENKYSDNTTGKFYVDDQCIDCDLCRETAPANFTRQEDGGYSFVYKQPESEDEEALCKEAMEGCPVEAIGSDGA